MRPRGTGGDAAGNNLRGALRVRVTFTYWQEEDANNDVNSEDDNENDITNTISHTSMRVLVLASR